MPSKLLSELPSASAPGASSSASAATIPPVAEDRPQQNQLLGGERRSLIRQLAGTLLDCSRTRISDSLFSRAESALTDVRRRRACRSSGHPRTSTRVGHTQRRRQPSTLVGVQGVRTLFESPNGRLDAHPARTQELVQFSGNDPKVAARVVFGQFAGSQPSPHGLAGNATEPSGLFDRVEDGRDGDPTVSDSSRV